MFRKEAIKAKRHKLHGDVFLIQPVSFSVLGLLIISIVTFSSIILVSGNYARSENVIGHLVPSKGLVKIQTPRFGTLESIDVKENDTIKSGQKLAAILVSTSTSDGISFADKALAALSRQEMELQTQITLENNQREAEIARLTFEQEAVALRVQSLGGQLELQRQIANSAEGAFNDVQNLLRQGYISKEASKNRRREWLNQKSQVKLREQELSSEESTLKQHKIRLLQLPNESKQRLARLMSQQAELEGKKTELSGRSAYTISSSVEGKVLSISMDSIGRSVQSGQPLLTILPAGSVLEAELFVPSRAIGFVEKGQQVKLLYDAFPYQFFGSHNATITAVTESILAPGEILAPFELKEPVYRVTANIEKKTIDARGKEIILQSGMTLRANIILERRSFLDWLLAPLRAVRDRA
ncbi:MAG: membrane fusion protein [Planctomycetota bacterium]|jgi:membrane fusion protein